jgi:hypothetical protein
MQDLRLIAFQSFIRQCDPDLKRIASHTRREFGVEDLQNESWVIAQRLAQKNQIEITLYFTDRAHQRTLLSHLYNSVVKFRESKIRNAVRLDQADADERDKYDTMLGAAEPEICEPSSLLAREAESINGDPDDGTVASGYLYLLRQADGSKEVLAETLMISRSYLDHCLTRAIIFAKYQHCLFSGAAHDERQPLRGWRKFRIRKVNREDAQNDDLFGSPICGIALVGGDPVDSQSSIER